MRSVCMIASAHPQPYESRIFHRESLSLVQAGYRVTLITQGSETHTKDGVEVIALPAPRNRFDRMTRHAWKAFRIARRQRADVYHFHNPEFIPYALLLKLLGARVIYDAHEAFRDKLVTREYLPRGLRFAVSRIVGAIERVGARLFDAVVVADSYVAQQFSRGRVVVVANFPRLSMLPQTNHDGQARSGKTVVVYAGDLSIERGIPQMVSAMRLLQNEDIELRLMGVVKDPGLEADFAEVPAIRHLGFLPLSDVFLELAKADIGIVVLQPVPGYTYAGENTNKLFEYMGCGLAVIASDFPNLRRFVDGVGCGVCVDPESETEIAQAIRKLHVERNERTEMGKRGRRAVYEQYNWEKESEKLCALYASILAA